MAFRVGSYLFVLCLVFTMLQVSAFVFEVPQDNCYETLRRCSGWSSRGTGKLWKTCNDRCTERGYTGGICRLCFSTCEMRSKPWQCRCNEMPPC